MPINRRDAAAPPRAKPGKIAGRVYRPESKPKQPAGAAPLSKSFPRTYKKFQAYFGTGGTLADGNECDYIFALSALQSHHVAEVGTLLVRLSKDAESQGNAPSCLQNVMANYGSHFTRSFAVFL